MFYNLQFNEIVADRHVVEVSVVPVSSWAYMISNCLQFTPPFLSSALPHILFFFHLNFISSFLLLGFQSVCLPLYPSCLRPYQSQLCFRH